MNLLDPLTTREKDVAKALANGLTNREIANALVITVNTVQTHVSRVLHKTGTRNRTQLAILAMQSDLQNITENSDANQWNNH